MPFHVVSKHRGFMIFARFIRFYGRKVGKFTAVNRPIYGNLFTGSQYKKDVNFGA